MDPGAFPAFAESPAPSLFGLAPGGVCRAAGVAAGAVRSYRTVSPLPRRYATHAAVCSLWHFPWARPPDVIRHRIHGARTFLPDPPFGMGPAAVQPTDATGMGMMLAASRENGRMVKGMANSGSEWRTAAADYSPSLRAIRRLLSSAAAY